MLLCYDTMLTFSIIRQYNSLKKSCKGIVMQWLIRDKIPVSNMKNTLKKEQKQKNASIIFSTTFS